MELNRADLLEFVSEPFTKREGNVIIERLQNIVDSVLVLDEYVPGEGTGDMLAANNLSDVENLTTAKGNLGFKHQRQTTGSIGGGLTALITIVWLVAFEDTNYTPFASLIDSTSSVLGLSIVHIESKTETQVQVRVVNAGVGAITGTINLIAIHD